MVIILYALGAMLCTSTIFLAGAVWAAMPRLQDAEGDAGLGFQLMPSAPADHDGLTLAR